jgi:cysteine dioxygenase
MPTIDMRLSVPRVLEPLVRTLSSMRRTLSERDMSGLLENWLFDDSSLGSLTSYSESEYVRTLYHRDTNSELLVLGWLEGQASLAHDHGSSVCGMRVCCGEAVELELKHLPNGMLSPQRVERHTTGTVTICGRTAIHQIANECSAPLVTVHLYSPPLADGHVYDCNRFLMRSSPSGQRSAAA